jgi:hypothetical protein
LQTFVAAKDFTLQIPCFNATSDEFNEPTPSGTATAKSTGASQASATAPPVSAESSSAPSSGGGGLSTGAKAGIGVGVSIAGLLVLGAIAFFLYRRGISAGLTNRESYELRASKLNTGDEASAAASARSA